MVGQRGDMFSEMGIGTRREKKHRHGMWCLLVLWVMACSGCALVIGAAAVTGGSYLWTLGNLEATVGYPAVDVYRAARRTLDQLEIAVERDRNDRFGANISGRYLDGRKALIKIIGETEYTSRIRVRVGMMGDRGESQVVMNRILGNI